MTPLAGKGAREAVFRKRKRCGVRMKGKWDPLGERVRSDGPKGRMGLSRMFQARASGTGNRGPKHDPTSCTVDLRIHMDHAGRKVRHHAQGPKRYSQGQHRHRRNRNFEHHAGGVEIPRHHWYVKISSAPYFAATKLAHEELLKCCSTFLGSCLREVSR